MIWYMKEMEHRLTPGDAKLLKEIYRPQVVGVPATDVWRSLCVAPGGEIRSYGVRGRKADGSAGQRVYLASADCGLSWKLHMEENDSAMGPAVRSPYSGRYLSVIAARRGIWPRDGKYTSGLYAITSDEGPSSVNVIWRPISDMRLGDVRLPIPLRRRRRWIVLSHTHTAQGAAVPLIFLSDDDGESWRSTTAETVPPFEMCPPHEGMRWQNGASEPTVTELDDGTLLMMVRTSQNYHYIYYSHDGGDTWSHPEPSSFHGTITMPTLFRMSAGETLLFWCNTQPLPELNHEKQWPPLLPSEISGGVEDVFTNRDANHAAISADDGKTWRGLREIGLNAIRNHADFRTDGGNDDTVDKSVHQFEALELPFQKILLQYGQHPASRRLVIFDPKWLYETERTEDFRYGLGALSTQVYVKSNSGNFRGFSGHCAWNRTNGTLLVPDPDGNFEEALLFCKIHDDRLFSEVQGADWNFPAAHRGEVTVRLRILGGGIRLSLTDRWFNPVDVTIAQDAQYSVVLNGEGLRNDVWNDIRLAWDNEQLIVFAGEKPLLRQTARFTLPNGLCYLHLQAVQKEYGTNGTLVKRLSMRRLAATASGKKRL